MEPVKLGNEEIYRLLAENMLDMVSQHHTDGTILWVSPSVTNMLGYDPDALVGTNFYDLFQQDDRDYMLQFAHELTLTEGYNPNVRIEYRIRKKTGGYLWFESMTKPIRDDNGTIVKLQITSRDITKRQRAEQALLISKKRQELALEGADLGLWDLNLRSGRLIVSERWAGMLGYKVDEIDPTLKGWAKLVHPEDLKVMNKALRDHLSNRTSTYETEHRLRTKDAGWKWILSRGKVLEWDDDGKPFRAVGTHLDITANKKLEIAVMKAVMDTEESERTRFAKDLHDGIGQYLSAIRMHLDAIKENIKEGRFDSCEALINVANSHIDATVGDLREISHNLMPGSLKDLGLEAALEEMFEKLLGATPIEVTFNSNFDDDRLPSNIEINIYRVCQQMLSNTLQHANARSIQIDLSKTDEELNLIYKDDGKGISNDNLPKITGNGLRNIESRVKSLHGTIHFHSGEGFKATINIPLKETEYLMD